MRKYFVTTRWFRPFFSKDLIWELPNDDKIIYLTFDDGPTPGVTYKVLKLLKQHNARATFFCIGKNVMAHPKLYQRILDDGHRTGSHTQNHSNATKVSNETYFEGVRQSAEVIHSNLFRPPYGRIKNKHIRTLKEKYKIIMWSVLSGDFDKNLSKEKCKHYVLKYTRAGSIVVFHDSIKASEKMLYALEVCLKYFNEKGYRFKAIDL